MSSYSEAIYDLVGRIELVAGMHGKSEGTVMDDIKRGWTEDVFPDEEEE